MVALYTVEECRQDLIAAMTFAHAGEAVPEVRIGDDYITDYAKICAFLSDRERAIAHLTRLNSVLLLEVNRRGMQKVSKFLRKKKQKLKKTSVIYTRHDGQKFTGRYRATQNVLANFLDAWEQAAGFNQGIQQQEGPLPPRPAELTAFVGGADFRRYLLKHGYHWSDIAVAASHGDFTHRLHWYMICEEQNHQDGNWLSHSPLELFKLCGEPESVNPNNRLTVVGYPERYTIWDQIVDNYVVSKNAGSPLKDRTNEFRCPETLHGFLKQESTRKRPDLWVLAQIIYSRAARVADVKLAQNLGPGAIDDTYKAFEENPPDDVVLRGFETGSGTAHPGTIMWRNIASNQALGWFEDLVS